MKVVVFGSDLCYPEKMESELGQYILATEMARHKLASALEDIRSTLVVSQKWITLSWRSSVTCAQRSATSKPEEDAACSMEKGKWWTLVQLQGVIVFGVVWRVTQCSNRATLCGLGLDLT